MNRYEPRFRCWTFPTGSVENPHPWLHAIWAVQKKYPDQFIFSSTIDEWIELGSDDRWELYQRAVVVHSPSTPEGAVTRMWALDEHVDKILAATIATLATRGDDYQSAHTPE